MFIFDYKTVKKAIVFFTIALLIAIIITYNKHKKTIIIYKLHKNEQ